MYRYESGFGFAGNFPSDSLVLSSVLYVYTCEYMGSPGGSVGKESTCIAAGAEDTSSILGSGRSPGGGHGNPLPYSCLENPMDRGAWQPTVHGVSKESGMTESYWACTYWLFFFFFLFCCLFALLLCCCCYFISLLKVYGNALSHPVLTIMPWSGWHLHFQARETKLQSSKGFWLSSCN